MDDNKREQSKATGNKMRLCEDMSHTDSRNKDVLRGILALSDEDQSAIAEAIRLHPSAPIADVDKPVQVDAKLWARSYVAAESMRSYAYYMRTLSWFYSTPRPTNALEALVYAKVNTIRDGEDTDNFYGMLREKLKGLA